MRFHGLALVALALVVAGCADPEDEESRSEDGAGPGSPELSANVTVIGGPGSAAEDPGEGNETTHPTPG